MIQDRNKLLKINSTAALVYQVVALVCGFILPKLIISNFGSSVNGLLSSITHFLGFIALCDMGMGAVVPASLYKPLASKDNDEISRIVVSSERFYRTIAKILLLYIVILTIVYPNIVEGFTTLYKVSLIVIIASATFAQYYFGITNSLLITADQRQYFIYIVNGATLILNLIASYILIKLGCTIHVVKLLSAAIFIFRPICFTYFVKNHYALNKKIELIGEPIKQKWNGIAQHLAYTVQEKTSFIVLSVLSTLENVSVFSIYFLILEGIRGIVYTVSSSLTSYMGNLIASDEQRVLHSKFLEMEWFIHTVAVVVFSCAAVLIVPFVSVYTFGIHDADYLVPYFPYIICAAICCRCLQLPYNIVVQAAGHFKETQNSAIIEPIINIITSIILVTKFNLTGVALGMLISILYRFGYLSLYLTKHIVQSSKIELLKRILVDLILVGAIVFPCSFFSMQEIGYLSWVIMSIKVVAVAAIVMVLVNMVFYRGYLNKLFLNVVHFKRS